MSQAAANSERRRFQRFPLDAKVRLYSGTASWQTELIDISLKGVLLTKPKDWDGKIGESYRVGINIESTISISMSVKIAHLEDTKIGCECSKIDLESFAKLKRLVELNLGDPSLLNRELTALG